jgi:hypothetical protein
MRRRPDHALQPESGESARPVAPSEWRWVLGFGVFVALLTSLPYLLGFIFQGDQWVFNGGVFAVEDVNSYLANMVSGSSGAWLFRTPYTVDPQSPSLFFLHYLWLGKLAAPPDLHLKIVLLYHAFRMVSILLVCLATYDLIAFFIPETVYRRWGLVLGTLGGGAGWVILVFQLQTWLATLPLSDIPGLNLPLEFYSPETFGFLALFGLPHVALARAGLLWGVRLYLGVFTSLVTGNFPWMKGAQTGVVWLLTLLAQPITGMLSGAVAGLFLLAYGIKNLLTQSKDHFTGWQTYLRAIGMTLWIGLFPLPLVVYYLLVFQTSPVLSSWQLQSPLPSPNPLLYVFAYGLMLPFVALGIYRQIGSTRWLLPISWFLSTFVLAYAPFNMQRRLVDGVWIALIILAMAGVRPGPDPQPAWRHALPRLFKGASILSLVTTFILLVGAVTATLQPRAPLYHPADQVNVMEQLGEIAQPGEVVLSAPASGNVLPGYAPVRVVIGISTLTANYPLVERRVAEVFSLGLPDEQRRGRLQDWSVDYLFYGPAERALGEWNPETAAYLQRVIEQGEYALYRVDLSPAP